MCAKFRWKANRFPQSILPPRRAFTRRSALTPSCSLRIIRFCRIAARNAAAARRKFPCWPQPSRPGLVRVRWSGIQCPTFAKIPHRFRKRVLSTSEPGRGRSATRAILRCGVSAPLETETWPHQVCNLKISRPQIPMTHLSCGPAGCSLNRRWAPPGLLRSA